MAQAQHLHSLDGSYAGRIYRANSIPRPPSLWRSAKKANTLGSRAEEPTRRCDVLWAKDSAMHASCFSARSGSARHACSSLVAAASAPAGLPAQHKPRPGLQIMGTTDRPLEPSRPLWHLVCKLALQGPATALDQARCVSLGMGSNDRQCPGIPDDARPTQSRTELGHGRCRASMSQLFRQYHLHLKPVLRRGIRGHV